MALSKKKSTHSGILVVHGLVKAQWICRHENIMLLIVKANLSSKMQDGSSAFYVMPLRPVGGKKKALSKNYYSSWLCTHYRMQLSTGHN